MDTGRQVEDKEREDLLGNEFSFLLLRFVRFLAKESFNEIIFEPEFLLEASVYQLKTAAH